MTCLSSDNLSLTSSDVGSGPAFRSLCSPFSDLSSSSAAIHSAIKQNSSSKRNWLNDATADSLERRRMRSRSSSSSRQRCSSLPQEKKRLYETSQHCDRSTPEQRSYCSTPVSMEDKINWALNHSSDINYPEELRSSSGISCTASGSTERVKNIENQHALPSHSELARYISNDGVGYENNQHTKNLNFVSKTFEKELTQALVHTITELKDLAEIARVIDDVDDEEWLLMFIGELEIHLHDLLRAESKQTASTAYSEIKQKQTLLSVAEDLVRYLKERCRWTLERKSSVEAEFAQAGKSKKGDSTLERMKTLASSTTDSLSSLSQWQNKLSRLAITLDRYLSLLMSSDDPSTCENLKDVKSCRDFELSNISTQQKMSQAAHFAVQTPLPKPRQQHVYTEYNKNRNVTSHENHLLFSNLDLSSQRSNAFASQEELNENQPDDLTSTLALEVGSNNMLKFEVHELNNNATETDFLFSNVQPQSYDRNIVTDDVDGADDENSMNQYRATACECPQVINLLADAPSSFCSSLEPRYTAKNVFFSYDDIDSKPKPNANSEVTLTNFVSSCFQTVDDDTNIQIHDNPQIIPTFTTSIQKELLVNDSVTNHHETSSLTFIPHHNKLKPQRFSSNVYEEPLQDNASLTSWTKKQTSKEKKKLISGHSRIDSGSENEIPTKRLSSDIRYAPSNCLKESKKREQPPSKPVRRITSSVQCDIVSDDVIKKSEEEIRKLRESTALLRRGITEAREERDEKDRKIAILESRVQRLNKNMEVRQMERGSAAVELERMRRMLEREKKDRDNDIADMKEKNKKLEEENERMHRRIYELQEWIEKLKKENFENDKNCKQLEQEKKVLESKLYEATMSLMKEKHHNRKLYVDNLKLEQEVTKWREKEKLQEKKKAEKERKEEVTSILKDLINKVTEETQNKKKQELNELKQRLAVTESVNSDLRSKNEELQTQLSNQKKEALAATDCFRQQIEFLSNEVSIQRESARLQKEEYDSEISRLFSSRSADYNANASTDENGLETESLRSQLVYQETLTRTLYAENERLRNERDELQAELSSHNQSSKAGGVEFGCQVEDTTYTKMKAQEFYLQEALRNARRLRDRGARLQKETLEAARQTRKIDVEITLQTLR